MKVSIFAVGRMKSGPEKDLADRYLQRFARSGSCARRRIHRRFRDRGKAGAAAPSSDAARRSAAILGQLGDRKLILLDEAGQDLPSEAFADKLGRWRDDGLREIQFAIGGPDGHDPELKVKAALVLSFGAATWPHQIVRILLAEQLYRATTILSGHPYHRGGPG